MMKRIVAIANSASSERDRNEWVSQTEPHGAVDEKKEKEKTECYNCMIIALFVLYTHKRVILLCFLYESIIFIVISR
jgi:hypothetical protein